MNRRNFVQKSALATAGALAAPSLLSMAEYEKLKQFGVALYTVRNNLNTDFDGTLKALRKVGFDYCEAFDFEGKTVLGKSIAEAKKSFAKAKLPIKSLHLKQHTMRKGWQEAVDNAAELGAQYMILAWLSPEERKSIDQYKELIDLINKSAEVSNKSGIQFLYHNHEFEFETVDGQVPYDLILGQTDKNLVKMELDIYWTRFADQDPLKLFRENRGRFPLWHIKDMVIDEDRKMTEVGAGRIDWRQIFAHAQEAGMQGFYVEQDGNWTVDPISSTQAGYKHLKGLRF